MSHTMIVLLVVLTIFSANIFANNCGENEEYKCGSACQTTCRNLGQVCPIQNIRCNDACYCIKGYARRSDDKSSCIPISECSKRCK